MNISLLRESDENAALELMSMCFAGEPVEYFRGYHGCWPTGVRRSSLPLRSMAAWWVISSANRRSIISATGRWRRPISAPYAPTLNSAARELPAACSRLRWN